MGYVGAFLWGVDASMLFFGYAYLIVRPHSSVYILLSAQVKKVSCCTISVPPRSALVNALQSGSCAVHKPHIAELSELVTRPRHPRG